MTMLGGGGGSETKDDSLDSWREIRFPPGAAADVVTQSCGARVCGF